MAKRKKTKKSIDGVLLDCKTPEILGKKFSKEHAENLLKLQASQGRDNWTLSEGQGLKFENGNITTIASSGTSQKATE